MFLDGLAAGAIRKFNGLFLRESSSDRACDNHTGQNGPRPRLSASPRSRDCHKTNGRVRYQNRAQHILDDFEKTALSKLHANPKQLLSAKNAVVDLR